MRAPTRRLGAPEPVLRRSEAPALESSACSTGAPEATGQGSPNPPSGAKSIAEKTGEAATSAVREAELRSAELAGRGLHEHLVQLDRALPKVKGQALLDKLLHLERRLVAFDALPDHAKESPSFVDLLAKITPLIPPLTERLTTWVGKSSQANPWLASKLGAATSRVTAKLGALTAAAPEPPPPEATPSAALERAESALMGRGAAVRRETARLGDGSAVVRLVIEPDPKTRLGRVAERLVGHGVALIYSPDELQRSGANGAYQSSTRSVFLDRESVLEDRLSPTGLHELRHMAFHRARERGTESLFHLSFHAFSRGQLSRYSQVYQQYMSAEELSTFARNLRQHARELPVLKPGQEAPDVPSAISLRARSLVQLCAQTVDVLGRAERALDEVLSETRSPAFLRRLRDTRLVARHRASSFGEQDSVSFMIPGAYVEFPLVSERQKRLHGRAAEAREALNQAVSKHGGLLGLLGGRRELRRLRNECHQAEAELLQAIRTDLRALRERAVGLSGLASRLHEQAEAHEVLRYVSKAEPEAVRASHQALRDRLVELGSAVARATRL